VFLGIGVDVLGNNPGLARTLIGSLLNATKLAGGSLSGRVLFIVDEAARLGHMKVLEEMRDTGRKYGITLIMLYQSLGQIRAQWGGEAGLSDWMQSTGCQIFGAINDQDTAERISKKTGTYTAEVTSTSTSTVARGSAGGSGVNRTTTTNLVSVPLIRPSEITQNMRADEQIVFFGSMSPIRCGRAIYFRRPEMLNVAGEDRFTQIGKPSASPPSPEQPKA
jgi:type IV secretion system protein VirD4